MTPTTLNNKAARSGGASGRSPVRAEIILDYLNELPALPAVAVRVLETTASDASAASDVVRLIESDPALTTKVLRLLQRPGHGVRSGAATVERAVILLGFAQVRAAVLSVSIYDVFRGVDAGEAGSPALRADLWKHSVAVACASRLVAQQCRGPAAKPEEAFVAGLLHDVGKLALEACLPKAYQRVVDRAVKEHRPICDVEQDVLGVDHTVAARRLLTRWGLPREVVEAAWLHHLDPRSLPAALAAPTMVRIVHAADALVRQLRIGICAGPGPADVERRCEELGLTRDQARELSAAIPGEFEACASAFDLDAAPTDITLARALSEANAELGRVNSRLDEAHRATLRRGRCFEAFRHFAGLLHADDPIGTVAEKIAETAVLLFDSGRAAVFATIADPAVAATWDKDRAGRSQRLSGVRAENGASRLGGSGGFRAAQPADIDLLRRIGGLEGPGEPVVLPLDHAGSEVGRVVLRLPDHALSAWNTAGRELEGLSLAWGLALSHAAGREQSERFQEALVEANRRVQSAQAELLHRKSLSMVSEMAAGAAHELNNPLAVIAGRAQMLSADSTDPATLRALEIIAEQAKRASGIVNELMSFAKPRQPMPVPIRLADFLEVLWKRWTEESSLTEDHFEVRLADTGVQVYADPAALQEVFNALLSNAVAAMKPETARLIINSPSAASDETVRIRIEDNGAGMDAEVLERAFDPFFSHRHAGRGRGMGLSRALRLIEIGRGKLSLESSPGVGTTVFIELPARAPADPAVGA
ncbi:MAG: hypothetical protein BroJett003_19040 [Planctomycetota bacterium]|nr:MAG: hypothetical protein BroJett003_19040 [Planctomycetota bacterium]